MDASKQKKALLKARIQPWINEAFTITTDIEGKLSQMQGLYALRQAADPHKEASEEHMQQVQQTAEQCATDLQVVWDQLAGLYAKISTPTE